MDKNGGTIQGPQLPNRSISQPGESGQGPCHCSSCKGAMIPLATMRNHMRLQDLIDQKETSDLIGDAILARAVNPSSQPTTRVEEEGISSTTSEIAYEKSSSAFQDLYARCWQLDKMPLPRLDLSFLFPPRTPSNSLTPPSHLELDKTSSSNFAILDRQESFCSLKRELDSIDDLKEDALRSARAQVEDYIYQAEKRLLDRITREWEVQAARVLNKAHFENVCTVVDTSRYFDTGNWKDPMVHIACWLLVLILNLVFGTSQRQSAFILKSLDVIIGIALATCAHFQQSPAPLLPPLRFDLRTAMSRFNLDSPLSSFICCPRCHALYALDGVPNIPDLCPGTSFSGSCGEELFKSKTLPSGEVVKEPQKLFEYRSPKDWLGELMSRPGMEEVMDNTAKSAFSRAISLDIWHGKILPAFKWKDGSSFWESASGGGRYMFSLGIDWFNPLHGVASQKTWSIGAIYLVLLNLPPAIRMLPENICLVGIIPGPRKPHGDSINHFLRPLINDLLDFWNQGVWYTRTALYPFGRLVHAALGPLVCDLDAARGIAGFTSHTHTLFCSLCYLCRNKISNLDRSTWTPRCWADHKKKAYEWRDAETSHLQDEIRDSWGLRWSELLRLPYWDPLRFTVIDVMHNMFLGNLKRHCRNIWKMNIDVEGEIGDGLEFDKSSTEVEMEAAHVALRTKPDKSLNSFHRHILRDLCRDCKLGHKLTAKTTKEQMVKLLLEWRIEEGLKIEQQGRQHTQLSNDDLQKCNELLESKSFAQLKNCKHAALYQLCESKGLREKLPGRARKQDMLAVLETWATNPSAVPGPSDKNMLGGKEPSKAEMEDGRATMHSKSTAAIGRLKHPVLYALCREFMGADSVRPDSTKPELVEALLAWRLTRGIHDKDSASLEEGSATVIGSKILTEIELDMRDTVLPDWIQKAPYGLGSKGNGKLSADQWRVTCSIHFIITLIRIWGASAKESMNFKMLDNYIHLVLAASLSARRSTFRERWERVIYHMSAYLNGVRELYPWANLVPNHHLALHLDRFLESFGPSHAWWAFPFERFNGMLQGIRTNFKLGDLERTIMRSFSRASRLKALVTSRRLPPALKGFYDIVVPLLSSKYKGSLTTDHSALALADWVAIPEQPHNAQPLTALELTMFRTIGIKQQDLQDCAYLEGKGARFYPISRKDQTRWEGGRNSYILYQPEDGPPVAARISRIVRPNRSDDVSPGDSAFILVHHYDTLSDEEAQQDPYRQWPELGSFLVYNSFVPGPKLIRPSQIIAHIARCPYHQNDTSEGRQKIIVLSLDRS